MIQHNHDGVVREILTDDHPVLRTPSEPVDLADSELIGDIADLAATLGEFRQRAGFGRAISAPQIGVSKRLVVLNLGAGPIALINPRIIERSETKQQIWDDCLSLPDKLVLVERSVSISIEYTSVQGMTVSWPDLPANLAELLQHEIDHLDGVLMTDRAIGDSIRPAAERSSLIGPAQATPKICAEAIAAAGTRVDSIFMNSPQYNCEALSAVLGCRLLLKVETLNPIGCFKGRGASLLIEDLVNDQGPDVPIVTASAGNWGQAVAYHCRKYAIPCVVFAPQTANSFKVQRIRDLNATVHLAGSDLDEAKHAARVHAAAISAAFVEDGQDAAVAIGHGTIAIELLGGSTNCRQPHLDALLIPVGNGSLINGIATWIKAASPATRIIGVTPTGAPAMHSAWAHPAEPASWETGPVNTIADGLAVREPVADAVAYIVRVVDEFIDVDDNQIQNAMQLLYAHGNLVTEPSGAAGVAAIAVNPHRFSGKSIGTIVCGANIDDSHRDLLSTTPIGTDEPMRAVASSVNQRHKR